MGQLKTKDPKQNSLFSVEVLLYLRLSSAENNNSFKKTFTVTRVTCGILLCYTIALSLSIFFSVDLSHLRVIIVQCENEYRLLLDNRTHAHKLCELTAFLQNSVKMTK